MNIFQQHETFEMEVLEHLKNKRLLEYLVFGGGSMLRLCHELPRYSVDLDFWRIKEIEPDNLFAMFHQFLEDKYEITDEQMKHFSLLFELRSTNFPKRLKIEIRKKIEYWDLQEKIAYSKFTTKQVIIKAHTLKQTMRNKINALMERKEIRDGFDIEFLIRQGIGLPNLLASEISNLTDRISEFKANDFKVTLGSVLDADLRAYYIENRFQILEYKLKDLTN
jgi:hypothetical protein